MMVFQLCRHARCSSYKRHSMYLHQLIYCCVAWLAPWAHALGIPPTLVLTGAKAACVELPFDYISSDTKGGVGGTCVLRGCVPKKLMVYASEYADDFRDSVGFG
eukprot:GHRR01034712.1.p1 GENE.GHRR01034712.1~~GHRR01034712.1.p1  ORF type:complete len:104 (+),score=33.14 GHRR01034712.1:167-478(+)